MALLQSFKVLKCKLRKKIKYYFPLNVYKCDAIISKHKMLFQNVKIPGCYLKFLGRKLI